MINTTEKLLSFVLIDEYNRVLAIVRANPNDKINERVRLAIKEDQGVDSVEMFAHCDLADYKIEPYEFACYTVSGDSSTLFNFRLEPTLEY